MRTEKTWLTSAASPLKSILDGLGQARRMGKKASPPWSACEHSKFTGSYNPRVYALRWPESDQGIM